SASAGTLARHLSSCCRTNQRPNQRFASGNCPRTRALGQPRESFNAESCDTVGADDLGERRSFALLRPIADVNAQNRVRELVLVLVLEAFAEYEEGAAVASSS